jgi:dipeptidase D
MNLFELEPKDVIRYFYEINQIPRESGNEKAISDYLVAFAKDHQLMYLQDKSLNVLITKEATLGYESIPGVIIQGHMDMVCEKNAETQHDFLVDPIEILIEGDHLKANGTTLGADNGIAVAMGLAILANKHLVHPKIELLITTDEEVGMTGAINFDASLLTGKYFLNLDSEEEGEFVISCAGGLKAMINLPLQKEIMSMTDFICKEVSIKKLIGGHSGVEIDKSRANAIKLTGRILCKLDGMIDFHLVDIHGGRKDNVIPRETFFTIILPKQQELAFEEALDRVASDISNEYRTSDPEIEIVSETLDIEDEIEVILDENLEKAIFLLMNLPNGIQTMSAELVGFVESSLNIGKIAVEDDHLSFLFAVRSSVRSIKYHIADQLETFAKYCNAEFIKTAEYPEWPLKKESYLLQQATRIFETMYGKKPIVKSLHAGVEPGVFLEKREDIEAISLGPDMQAVHSPNEWVSISSIQRTYEFIIELLKNIQN